MNERNMHWPTGKKSAAMVSIELDGEFIWLLLDPTNASRPKTLSMGTYGQHRGLDRLLKSLEERDVTATFFVPGIMAERHPEQVLKVAGAGHEIALHGYAHSNYFFLSPKEQREDIRNGIAALEKLTGKRPAGFRLPDGNMTQETYGILKEFGFDYDSSLYDDDLPYCSDSLVEIPMRWELKDFPYFAFNFHPPFPLGESRIASYSEVEDIWTTEQRAYHSMGLCFNITFDPQSIGTPARMYLFDQMLDALRQDDIWLATGSEIAAWCKDQEAQNR